MIQILLSLDLYLNLYNADQSLIFISSALWGAFRLKLSSELQAGRFGV
jgi:hypothetical protein